MLGALNMLFPLVHNQVLDGGVRSRWTAFGGKRQGGLAASYVKSKMYNCTLKFIFSYIFFTAANITKYILHTQLNFEQMKLGIQIGCSCTNTTTPEF